MKNLRINWLYNCVNPGYLFLLGFLLSIFSLCIFAAHQKIQHIIGLLIVVYLFSLIIIKYEKKLVVTTLTVVIIFLGLSVKAKSYSACDLHNDILIYPDQINIKDGFASGEGKIGKSKILINMPANKELELALKRNQILYLSNISAEVNPLDPPTNFGQFDYRNYYRSKNIYERLSLKNYQLRIKKANFFDYLHVFRNQLKNYFAKLPRIVSFMISEMILAENPDSKNKIILDNYRNLGVIHLLSISGLHVGLYTVFISTICTLLKRDEYETLFICTTFLIAEIFLADFQAGFVRASLGYFLGKVFALGNIPLAKGDRLGLVTIIHLGIKPTLFLNCGAILSYLLVLGLEIIGEKNPLKQGFFLNLLTTPILLNNFYQFNFFTIVFNLLIVPVFNFCLLPLTFLGAISFKLLPGATYFIEKIFTLIMNSISMVAQTKLGMIIFGKITWWQTIFLLIISSGLIIFYHNKNIRNRLYLSLGIGYCSIFFSIHFPLQGQVSIIDVGQGDSILITTPLMRKVYLIDTGGKVNFGKKKSEPQFNRITLPYLNAQGIDHLDGVFLSHQDADHIGDLGPLLEQVAVKKLYFAQGLNENPSFIKRIKGKVNHTKLIPLIAGNVVKEEGIDFHVVHPFKPGEGKNEDSLSLWFRSGGKSWLFTGDLDQAGEQRLWQNFPLQVDYFKLGHHGSKTSSNSEFLHNINPKLVFISAGRNNRFGHPHQETLQILKTLKIPYYTTQDSGTITWTYSPFTQKNKFSTFNQGPLHGTN